MGFHARVLRVLLGWSGAARLQAPVAGFGTAEGLVPAAVAELP